MSTLSELNVLNGTTTTTTTVQNQIVESSIGLEPVSNNNNIIISSSTNNSISSNSEVSVVTTPVPVEDNEKDILGVVTVSPHSAMAAASATIEMSSLSSSSSSVSLPTTTIPIPKEIMTSQNHGGGGGGTLLLKPPPSLIPIVAAAVATNTIIPPKSSLPTPSNTIRVIGDPKTMKVSTTGLMTSGIGGGGTTGAPAGGGPPPLQQTRSQDVRVDNWGNYCLQRLQVMYERGDFTDLILQFNNQEIVKVHRVVVNLCTEYFVNLERLFGLTNGYLILPKDIEHQAMLTIIKFFYTGKLEVRGNQFNEVYRTVKLMNITILTKLLEAHARKPIMQAKKESSTRPIVFKQAVEIGRPITKFQLTSAQAASLLPGGAMNKKLNARQFPHGVKTKTVLARVQPQTGTTTIRQQAHVSGIGNVSIIRSTTPKKLPIWKDRKYAPVIKPDPLMMEKWPPKDEPARPTRFEWPDPEEETNYMTTTTTSFMERQKVVTAGNKAAIAKRAEEIFDSVKNQQAQLTQSHHSLPPPKPQGLKRTIASTYTDIRIPRNDPESTSASKIAKLSLDIEKELAAMEGTDLEDNSVNKLTTDSSNQMILPTIQQPPIQNPRMKIATKQIPKPKIINQGQTTTSIMKVSGVYPTSSSQTIGNNNTTRGNIPERKSEKTVRFAPDVEKEIMKKFVVVPSPSTTTTTTTPTTNINEPLSLTLTLPSSLVTSSGDDSTNPGDLLSNHSKIISEVLKKYPQLVKDNKNIKLKIVQKNIHDNNNPGSTGTGSTGPSSNKSKISYIVLKSTSSPDSPGSVVLKKPSSSNKSSHFWDSPEKAAKKLSAAEENIKGPWLCPTCLVENVPSKFDSYFIYRRHLVESHGERIDARICEYCGYKASKRNLLLHHSYTKHGIDPPKTSNFPHCERCDYVALSESLLNKHRLNHDPLKEVTCTICDVSFKTTTSLHEHNETNLHRKKDSKLYECPYCEKSFIRILSLKVHIRSMHRDIARIEEMDDPNFPRDESFVTLANQIRETKPLTGINIGKKSRQIPTMRRTVQQDTTMVMSNEQQQQQQHDEIQSNTHTHVHAHAHGLEQVMVSADGSTIEILHGIDPTMSDGSVPISLVPSSEAEAMNNVASSIAASLGLDAHVQQVDVSGGYDGSQAVYIMDGSNQAVEVNMSGIEMTADGSMIIGGSNGGVGDDGMSGGQFIVQDMQGNQFQRITGIDENGKQVIFFQLSDEHGQITMTPTMLDESGQIINDNVVEGSGGTVVQQYEYDPTTGQPGYNIQNDHMYLDPQKCSVFVSSGVNMPGAVSAVSGIGGGHAHMVFTSTPDGNQLIEMVPIQPGSHEALLHHHHHHHQQQQQQQQQQHHHHHHHEQQQQSTGLVEMNHESHHHHHHHHQPQQQQQQQQQHIQEIHMVLDQQGMAVTEEIELGEDGQQGNDEIQRVEQHQQQQEQIMYSELTEVDDDVVQQQHENNVEIMVESQDMMMEVHEIQEEEEEDQHDQHHHHHLEDGEVEEGECEEEEDGSGQVIEEMSGDLLNDEDEGDNVNHEEMDEVDGEINHEEMNECEGEGEGDINHEEENELVVEHNEDDENETNDLSHVESSSTNDFNQDRVDGVHGVEYIQEECNDLIEEQCTLVHETANETHDILMEEDDDPNVSIQSIEQGCGGDDHHIDDEQGGDDHHINDEQGGDDHHINDEQGGDDHHIDDEQGGDDHHIEEEEGGDDHHIEQEEGGSDHHIEEEEGGDDHHIEQEGEDDHHIEEEEGGDDHHIEQEEGGGDDHHIDEEEGGDHHIEQEEGEIIEHEETCTQIIEEVEEVEEEEEGELVEDHDDDDDTCTQPIEEGREECIENQNVCTQSIIIEEEEGERGDEVIIENKETCTQPIEEEGELIEEEGELIEEEEEGELIEEEEEEGQEQIIEVQESNIIVDDHHINLTNDDGDGDDADDDERIRLVEVSSDVEESLVNIDMEISLTH